MRTCVWLAAILLSAAVAGGCAKKADDATPGSASEEADAIFVNGKVKTSDGWANAIAVRSGEILLVGADADVQALKGKSTSVFDLEGKVVLPGFNDTHVHPLFAGLRERECVIAQGADLPQIEAAIKVCLGRAGDGDWITGGQWDASAIGRIPDRQILDRISGDRPVVLGDTSGHSAWANSKALEIAGISRDTPNPLNGIIERDAAGEPTGILREDAIELVSSKAPKPSDEETKAALKNALDTMVSYGITSFTEASVGFPVGVEKELRAYEALSAGGMLKPRARLCVTWYPDSESFESFLAMRDRLAGERLRPDCVKIHLDGVPTDSHTAAMLAPYAGTVPGRDDEASRFGILQFQPAVLADAVSRFDKLGMSVKFHAAGDAAVRAGLDAINAARTRNGAGGPFHDVGHCTFVDPADVVRAKDMAAVFEVSPYLWSPSPINDDITKAIGDERIDRVWPVRDLLNSGAIVVPGSDWAVVPSVNPWIGIEALVTRERPGGSEDTFGKGQAITVAEAIDMFTVNGAKYLRQEKRLGSLAKGKLADFVVIDRNPYEISPHELHDTQVLLTVVGGEVVYDADATP